jgi:hypothetical protein
MPVALHIPRDTSNILQVLINEARMKWSHPIGADIDGKDNKGNGAAEDNACEDRWRALVLTGAFISVISLFHSIYQNRERQGQLFHHHHL